jgi:hypothetical protein
MTTGRAGLRVSDAERDAAAAELAEHLKEGRLDAAEFDERVGQAVTAKTRGDLDRLLADLPRPAPAPPPAPRRRTGWPWPLVPIALFVIFMAVAGAAGRAGAGHAAWAGGGHAVWALWWLWWLIPIGIFAARRLLRGNGPRGNDGPQGRAGPRGNDGPQGRAGPRGSSWERA